MDLRRDLEDPHAVSDILRILGTAPSALGRASASDVGECPYRGLSPFEEDDAPLFFGREREAALLVEKLRDARFLAVLGASGSGKSSLVRAGLVPALRPRSGALGRGDHDAGRQSGLRPRRPARAGARHRVGGS